MTEIPEHLLQRTRARKGGGDAKASSGDGAGGGSLAPASDSPASAGPPALVAAAAAIPQDDPPAAPKPEPAYVTAARTRKRMPVWAMGLVAAVPIWALSYAGTMQLPEVEDPLFTEAATLYVDGGCAGCHGAGGGGITGYAFTNGEVTDTFPHPTDQMVHVARGSEPINGEAYGNPDRPGGQRIAGERGQGSMPAQEGTLTQLELELVIFHERIVLGGDDPTTPENSAWIENLHERIAAGDEEPIDLETLLRCANPDMTPGATGEGGPDCPGGDVEEMAAE